jgi:uncharacterized membrane protein YtjA (UPF0391 family)
MVSRHFVPFLVVALIVGALGIAAEPAWVRLAPLP